MKRQTDPLMRALEKHEKEIDQLFKAERTTENFEAFGKLMDKISKEILAGE